MKFRIITPMVPNFVRIENMSTHVYDSVPLTTLDDDELDEMAEQWRLSLYENRDRQAKAHKADQNGKE